MKKPKKLKGMSLAEIVVAMAVLIIVAVMLVIGCTSAVQNARIAKQVSDKSATQAPYASSRRTTTSSGNLNINLRLHGTTTRSVMNVDTYNVTEGSGADDRSGDYKYFILH